MYKRIVKGHQGIFPFLPHSAQGRRQVSLKLAGIIHILLSMHSLTVLIATKKEKRKKKGKKEKVFLIIQLSCLENYSLIKPAHLGIRNSDSLGEIIRYSLQLMSTD